MRRGPCALAVLRLADLHGDLAVYIDGRDIHVLRVTDGTDVVLRRPVIGPVHAELESTGLYLQPGRTCLLHFALGDRPPTAIR